MQYNLAEKLAIVKAIDEVIQVDGQVNKREINLLDRIMRILKIERELLQEARKVTKKEGLLIFSGMPTNKKHALAVLLKEMAGADGRVDEREINLILHIFSEVGIRIDS
ncbi:TerB family tellurite resistance protein [Flavobacteriaceae bacterium TP-CH-4]|uniref:TerB family tellurite resistance protein n=1 Tax=Pelagihabitans pacificus TaxID=2696054 RepID=A0A967E6A7_9FLAO|nr:TerB family tellurite resistance protein [Pelagihabitans pacificus]NHF58969.1 TerB family tellurite resistance protein [Pelagihabitans pacificus]